MSPDSQQDHRRLAQREAAALTERHWVRLTKCCNNRCLFCLDTDAQDESYRDLLAIKRDIAEGFHRGRRRLILSGGEPTIHPALVELIAAGRDAGYERVQIISNGRMLAKPGFLDAAIEAGLGEITISVHGHTPELHDRLVGVPGAFVQTIRGLRAALGRQPGLIVNVDVVVCGENVTVLDRIIALCRKLGVSEFDLLQVQPAGRAATTPGMLYDVEPALETLSKVFALTRHPELFIWTNRFPVSHLEGFEELIQDPHKLIDEIRGRREQAEALLTRGEPFRCRGELCGSCYLQPLCDELHEYSERLRQADFEELLIDLRHGPMPPIEGESFRNVTRARLIANDSEDLAGLDSGSLPGWEVTLWIDGDHALEVEGLALTRLGGESVEVLEAAAALDDIDIEVAPSRRNEEWLRRNIAELGPRIIVRPAPRPTLSECLERDLPPSELETLLEGTQARVENIPHCLSGGRPVTWTQIPLQPMASPRLEESIERLVERFAKSRFRAKSVRCRSCSDDATCRGQHIQRLRAFGLATLRPR